MKHLPEPITFEYRDTNSYSNNQYVCSTPYGSTGWKCAVEKYGIRIPEVIDMTMGKSKCKSCGAIYVGHQPQCEAMVEFHGGSYHDIRGYNPHSQKNFLRKCGGYLVWDLQGEFNVQKQFFDLLALVSYLPDVQYDPLVKFSNHFPTGVPDVLRIQLMQETLKKVTMDISIIMGALDTIAGKMNAAGGSLRF